VKIKPRSEWKPRSQWKKRARGRVSAEIGDGLVVFEMTTQGVTARRKHGRRRILWTFEQLAKGIGHGGQINLL
jgi:hypothetical protein